MQRSSAMGDKMKAIAVFSGDSGVKGIVHFEQAGGMNEGKDAVRITGQITGLSPGKHGFHVHEFGDLSNGCISAGDHFNPEKKTHGDKDDAIRHVGDLGNVEADESGKVVLDITDNVLSLTGEKSILGRCVIVHEKRDDLGRGNTPDSKKSGSAGSRLACGVIGLQQIPKK